jgi:tetraacyldisaccharide 4'-kinase
MMDARNCLYDRGILPRKHLPRPVICVGNLTWGGTGKTPIVRWVAARLLEDGLRLALLTRGYGRKAEGLVLSAPGDPVDSHLLGDEPAMVKDALPDLWIGVHGDRWLAGNEILKRDNVDLFIMDDGFQHRGIARDLDLVVMRTRRQPIDRRLLPAGSLREPVKGLARAQAVILNETDGEAPRELLDLGSRFHCEVFKARMVPGSLVIRRMGSLEEKPAAPGVQAVLLSGIGSPESFCATAKASGVDSLEHISFPDHHWFDASDLTQVAEALSRSGAQLCVTTEKDWQRIQHMDISFPVATLGLDVQFSQRDGDALLDLIRERI